MCPISFPGRWSLPYYGCCFSRLGLHCCCCVHYCSIWSESIGIGLSDHVKSTKDRLHTLVDVLKGELESHSEEDEEEEEEGGKERGGRRWGKRRGEGKGKKLWHTGIHVKHIFSYSVGFFLYTSPLTHALAVFEYTIQIQRDTQR